jgi:hypothetical protein
MRRCQTREERRCAPDRPSPACSHFSGTARSEPPCRIPVDFWRSAASLGNHVQGRVARRAREELLQRNELDSEHASLRARRTGAWTYELQPATQHHGWNSCGGLLGRGRAACSHVLCQAAKWNVPSCHGYSHLPHARGAASSPRRTLETLFSLQACHLPRGVPRRSGQLRSLMP